MTDPAEEPAPDDDEPQSASGYDDMAEGYARFWAPVIRPGAIRVLDLVAAGLDAEGTREILDVGSGTGSLAIAALKRWPRHRVTGIDPSGGMLEVARATADEELPAAVSRRFRAEVASADRLPFDDETFDIAMSSFVLQLVRSRSAALQEVRRVLRPGGVFGWVAWLRTDRAFEPDRIANQVLDEAGFDPPEPDRRPGDLASVTAAAQGMRRAGFADVRAHAGEVEHAWDPEGYRAFLTEFDEVSLFDGLEATERGEIMTTLLERLAALAPEQLTLRLPVVYVLGRAPD